MSDVDEVPVDDRLTTGTSAHDAALDEDPLDHLGPEIPDPWEDGAQTDWRTPSIGEVRP